MFIKYNEVAAYEINGKHYHSQCYDERFFNDDPALKRHQVTRNSILMDDDLECGYYFCDHCGEPINRIKSLDTNQLMQEMKAAIQQS